jgi:butyrate kinase
LPVRALLKLCYSGRYAEKELDRQIFGDGGLFAYLGTRDLIEVERRIDAGDTEAARIFEALIYQVTKEAGSMAAVLKGQVDAVLVTGGMAYSRRVVEILGEDLRWIAPVHIYPGEDELQALADGVFRVLYGEEQPRRLEPQTSLAPDPETHAAL